MRRRTRLNAASGLLFLFLVASSNASPTKRLKRSEDKPEILLHNTTVLLESQSVCTVGDIVYQIGEGIPGSSPCEKCTCTGKSGVKCQSIQCEVRPGCKALHRADHCCPLYQCECTRNGKIYSNGEKLEDHENSCEVCYCQGGEIVCSRIECYERNDCKPVYVEGSCCPEYDHCPPRDVDRDLTSQINSREKNTFLSGDTMKFDFKESSRIDINNLPKIHIKEVTQGKPVNNEIRIKEVIPASSEEPTILRDVALIANGEDDNLTKNDINDTGIIDETIEVVSQPPQILRIGDQLLFLKQGEIVPENTSVITPSPVFTVIGAEGLQRVEDDSEDNSDKESMDKETSKTNNNVSILITGEEIEGLDEMIQETISELYATTTSEPNSDMDDEDYNSTAQTKVSTAGISTDDTSTVSNILVSSLSTENLDDDIQAVPIEHLPEHNPEYPPIPEDIMILSMTEDPLEPTLSEMELNEENLNIDLKTTDDAKIVIVKRPVIPLSIPKHTKSSNVLRENHAPAKILPDILPLVRVNKTNDNKNESFVPEEWLKESTGKPILEHNSPLLTLDSALPDSILNVPSTNSAEEDDSNEYIFLSNDTFKNSEMNVYKNEMTTDRPAENTESFTEILTIQSEYRSPGEPYLVPEWERNQTFYDINNTSITQDRLDNVTEDIYLENELVKENNTNDNEVEEENSFLEGNSDLDNNSTTSSTLNPVLTINGNESNFDDYERSIDKAYTAKNEVSTDSEDRYTNYMYSTEKLLDLQSKQTSESGTTKSTSRPLIQLESFGDEATVSPFDENIYPQKQKKSSALIGDKNDDSGKKRNILADLINLVGDVAAIGHDTEVSTVLNSIDLKDNTDYKYHKDNNPTLERDNSNILPLDNAMINQDNLHENSRIELTEYNASGDKMDSDIPMENDKVEFTTRKVLIDKDMDDKTQWQIDEVGKDIELIPKVEKNPPKKDPSLEKIKDGNNLLQYQPPVKNNETTTRKVIKEDVIIYTTIGREHSTAAPNRTKVMKPDDYTKTLITVDNINNNLPQNIVTESSTTENTFSSTIMKVTGKASATEETTNVNSGEAEKLTKREIDSQLMISPKDIIDNKYLDALKSYFERRFVH